MNTAPRRRQAGYNLIEVLIAMVVLTIIASVKASNGQIYRYPLTIRFLK